MPSPTNLDHDIRGVLAFAFPALAFATCTAFALFTLPTLGDHPDSRFFAMALTLDFTIAVPALVYFLLIRTGRLPRVALLPVFAIGFLLAKVTIPQQHQEALELLRWLFVPAELMLLTYLVLLARRALAHPSDSDEDFASRLRAAARKVLGRRLPADILTTEIALLYYAFRWPRTASQSPRTFSVHREVGYLAVLIGLVMVVAVETLGMHFLIGLWSVPAAWVVTGLSIYGAIWLIGDYRAVVARPIRLTPTHLLLRVGIRWQAEIPRLGIDQIETLRPTRKAPRDVLVMALLGQPNLRLRLRQPVEVIGLYGMRRRVSEIWLRADRAARLIEALRSPGGGGAAHGG